MYRHPAADEARPGSAAVRDPHGRRVLRVGRDLQPVPVDLRRHVRHQIRHHQCRAALHRQGDGRAGGAGSECGRDAIRQLGRRVPRRRVRQCGGRDHGADGAQADAAADVAGRRARSRGRPIVPIGKPALIVR